MGCYDQLGVALSSAVRMAFPRALGGPGAARGLAKP